MVRKRGLSLVSVKIPREWYDILNKLSRDKGVRLGQLLAEVVDSEGECLNLPEVELSGEFKRINVDLKTEESELLKKLRKFLFCVDD
jgi:hypothetical protein